MNDDQNVIYGGPVIKCTTAGCNSIGEVFLRQLNKNNDTIVLVRFFLNINLYRI